MVNEELKQFKDFLIEQLKSYDERIDVSLYKAINGSIQPEAIIPPERHNQLHIKKAMLLWFLELVKTSKPVNLEKVEDFSNMQKRGMGLIQMAEKLLGKMT